MDAISVNKISNVEKTKQKKNSCTGFHMWVKHKWPLPSSIYAKFLAFVQTVKRMKFIVWIFEICS